MPQAATAAGPPDWDQLKAGFEKKTSFEAACTQVIQLLEAEPAHAAAPELAALLRRVRVLLRSRYTAPAFIGKARELWRAAATAAEDTSQTKPLRSDLQQWVAEADELLGEPEGSPGSARAAAGAGSPRGGPGAAPYIFEGQLAGSAEPPAPAAAAASRPSALLQELQQMLAVAAQQQRQAPGADGAEQQQDGAGAEAPPAVPLEAVGELEAELLAQVLEESAAAAPTSRAAPPASKHVFARLPREKLTAERLAQLAGSSGGGGSSAEAAPSLLCSVCQEKLSGGDTALVMPCRHVYHPHCLQPWMETTNSCPCCRHELPTDCARYERRKVEEEDERGRRNAVKGGEFLFL